MGRKHWKTIYRELEKPTELHSDDGNSMCVIGTYSRAEAFLQIKLGLADYYGRNQPEYLKLTSLHQLDVAMLRRPNREDDYEDWDANFYAEKLNKVVADEHDVWIYFIKL